MAGRPTVPIAAARGPMDDDMDNMEGANLLPNANSNKTEPDIPFCGCISVRYYQPVCLCISVSLHLYN
jgi:hypothetical protein